MELPAATPLINLIGILKKYWFKRLFEKDNNHPNFKHILNFTRRLPDETASITCKTFLTIKKKIGSLKNIPATRYEWFLKKS